KVVKQAGPGGCGIQIRNILPRCIDNGGRDYVQLAVVADRIAERNNPASIRTCVVVSGKWIKNGANVEELTCDRIGTRRKGSSSQPVAKIATPLRRIRNRGHVAEGLAQTTPLIIAKDECLIFVDGSP